MLTPLARAVLVLVPLAFTTNSVLAHDLWINKGGFRNPTSNEWCCGAEDCAVLDVGAVKASTDGYKLDGPGTIIDPGNLSTRENYHETVPYTETLPSPDGSYWRCKRPDGTRRCFFAPPPGS